MEKGTKVNVKSINQNGVIMSRNDNRVSIMMEDGTAKVFDISDIEMFGKGGKVGDCIEYIKNSQPIKNNGYYLHIDNMNNYVASNSVKTPKIKSLCLITFNSGGQDNLKAVDTINSMSLSSEIAKLLDIDIEIARIIVSEQITHSKPFTISMLNDIENKNIIIADRDKIVCTNLSMKYEKGGVAEDKENAQMVLNNNKQIAHHTKELPNAIKGKKVPAWVVAKVNRSASDLSDATHYMDGQGESYAKGGSVELKWTNLSIGQRYEFLDSLGNEITPSSKEEYTKKAFRFLPKKIKEKFLQSKYADKYGLGGFLFGAAVGAGATYYILKNKKQSSSKSNKTKVAKNETKNIEEPKYKTLTAKEKDGVRLLVAITKDGFDYAIRFYSDYKNINDKKFVSLRKDYITNVLKLEKYIESKNPIFEKYDLTTISILDDEGIEYGFLDSSKSDWKGVKDAKFQALLKSAKLSYNTFQKYIKTKYKLKSFNDDEIFDRVNEIEIEKPEKMANGGGVDDLLEFTIPTWAITSLINGDDSGLEDEDIEKVNNFVDRVVEKYGNANFMLGDKSEETEFYYRNDIDGNMGGDVTTLYLRPTKKYANGGEVRNFDRHKQMDSNTRSEILDIIDDIDDIDGFRSLNNYLYGLFDGYDYSQTDDFKTDMEKLKSVNLNLFNRIQNVYSGVDKYSFYKMAKGGKLDFVLEYDEHCVNKILQMVSKVKRIVDYYVLTDRLVIVLRNELYTDDIDILNTRLKAMRDCLNVFEDEFEIGNKEGYKTLLLRFKTSGFSNNKFKEGGSISSKNESKKLKKTISVYKIITPFEVDSEDDFGKIYKLKKGQEVNVIEYYEDDSLAFLNINGKSYSTYDLLDNAKFVKGRKLKMSYAQGGMVDGQYVDLFEHYEHIPENIQAILDRYSEEFGGDGSDMDYQDTANMLKEVEAEGYTFNYYLDNEPYGLRPIGVKLNQLKDYEDFDEEDYAKGGRLTSNEDIIEAFLTSNREAKVGNLSTHYNEYDNQILLRNYGTLIASRKGNNVHITSIKYSVTTTKITNMVNRMAKDKGLNVKYVDKFEDGGNTSSYCYEIGGL